MSRPSSSRSPSPVARNPDPAASSPPSPAERTPNPVLSLSPLQSPVYPSSHAVWLEEVLLADMTPDEKWEVAVAKAPKCPKRATASSAEPPAHGQPSPGELAVASTSTGVMETTPSTPSIPGRGVKRSSAGEEGAIVDEILAFEGSRGATEGGEGWGETHSERAVEELHQWLLQSSDPASPPPPYDRVTRSPNFPPSSPPGVDITSGSSQGAPRHVREEVECERRFTQLNFAAIEPFPEEDQEWDADEPAPRPLQNLAQWPRGKGRRERFNPRSVESNSAVPPTPPPAREIPLVAAPPTTSGGDAETSTHPPEVTVKVARSRPADHAARREVMEATAGKDCSVFQRLVRRSSPQSPRRSPDRFPDLRGCPAREALFGGLRPVPGDGRDPPRGSCFNCRVVGHTRFQCREPPSLFCYNCGRRGTTLRACPRCGEAHLEYLREQGRTARRDIRSRSAGRPAEPRDDVFVTLSQFIASSASAVCV